MDFFLNRTLPYVWNLILGYLNPPAIYNLRICGDSRMRAIIDQWLMRSRPGGHAIVTWFSEVRLPSMAVTPNWHHGSNHMLSHTFSLSRREALYLVREMDNSLYCCDIQFETGTLTTRRLQVGHQHLTPAGRQDSQLEEYGFLGVRDYLVYGRNIIDRREWKIVANTLDDWRLFRSRDSFAECCTVLEDNNFALMGKLKETADNGPYTAQVCYYSIQEVAGHPAMTLLNSLSFPWSLDLISMDELGGVVGIQRQHHHRYHTILDVQLVVSTDRINFLIWRLGSLVRESDFPACSQPGKLAVSADWPLKYRLRSIRKVMGHTDLLYLMYIYNQLADPGGLEDVVIHVISLGQKKLLQSHFIKQDLRDTLNPLQRGFDFKTVHINTTFAVIAFTAPFGCYRNSDILIVYRFADRRRRVLKIAPLNIPEGISCLAQIIGLGNPLLGLHFRYSTQISPTHWKKYSQIIFVNIDNEENPLEKPSVILGGYPENFLLLDSHGFHCARLRPRDFNAPKVWSLRYRKHLL